MAGQKLSLTLKDRDAGGLNLGDDIFNESLPTYGRIVELHELGEDGENGVRLVVEFNDGVLFETEG